MKTEVELLTPNDEASDIRAAELAAQGVSVDKICTLYDPLISPQTARAAIARGRHTLDSQRPKPTPVAKAAPTTPTPISPAAKPKVSVPLEAEDLLARAEADGTSRARTLASAVRVRLAELAALHDKHAETAELRRFVGTLEKQLADAKAELKRLSAPGGAPSSSAPAAAPDKQERALIRVWANANGYTVGDVGKIPERVVAAYRTAHAGGDAS